VCVHRQDPRREADPQAPHARQSVAHRARRRAWRGVGSTTPGGSAATATVTLGGDTTADQVYVGRGSGTNGTLDLNGNRLFANDLLIGTSNGTGSLIHNGGHFELTDRLTVDDGNSFLFDAADVSADLTVTGGVSVTTAATSNVSTDVNVTGNGSQLNLGAALTLSEDLDIYASSGSATVDAQGHDIGARTIRVGSTAGEGQLLNDGAITADNLTIQDDSSVLLTGGDDVILSSLRLDDGGILDIEQAVGELAGLTLDGNSLSIDSNSLLSLSFDELLVSGLDWAFRWSNPTSGGDRVASLMDYVTDGLITWSAPWTVSVFDYGDGYTYIGYTDAQVPVPAGLGSASLLAGAGWLGWRRRRERRCR
jgi:hypothetical protein